MVGENEKERLAKKSFLCVKITSRQIVLISQSKCVIAYYQVKYFNPRTTSAS